MLTVDCVLPYLEYTIYTPPLRSAIDGETDVTVYSLDPEMVYVDEVGIDVLVHAEPVQNVTTLACRLHDVEI